MAFPRRASPSHPARVPRSAHNPKPTSSFSHWEPYFPKCCFLREPLTFYRLHGQNLFQVSDGSHAALRRKHDVLISLAKALHRRFAEERVPEDISKAIIESGSDGSGRSSFVPRRRHGVSTSFATELRIIGSKEGTCLVVSLDPQFLSLLPALLLFLPRRYTEWKRGLGLQFSISETRPKVVPHLRPTHVDRTGRLGCQR